MPDRRTKADRRVTVITAAQPSYEEAFKARRNRYIVMMLVRIPALILAAIFYQTPWLALLIIGISIPLPWMAVIIANDGPARKRVKVRRDVVNDAPQLTTGPGNIIESAESESTPADQ